MRSIWKGYIRFSLVTIPIRIYNAVDTAETVSFNLLHKEDHGRIGYEKRCKRCGEVVSQADIVKGFEYEPGQYVVIDPEDLAKIKLKSTRIIDVAGFVDASEVDPLQYEGAYFAGPDGGLATTYSLLAETLKRSGKVAVGKVVLRDREIAVMVAPREKGLVMITLRSREELRNVKDVPGLSDTGKVTAAEVKLAETLVEQMSTSIDELDLSDQYENAVKEMISAKVAGREIVSVAEEVAPVVDIMSALKASIEAAKASRKPMVKASGKKGAAAAEAEEKPQAKPAAKTAAKAKTKAAAEPAAAKGRKKKAS